MPRPDYDNVAYNEGYLVSANDIRNDRGFRLQNHPRSSETAFADGYYAAVYESERAGRPIRGLAKPEQGTIKQVAQCATCMDPIEKTPLSKRWYHSYTGNFTC